MLIYHGFITDVWCFITWTHEKIELKIKTRVPIWPAFVVTCGHVLSHLCGFTEKIAVEPHTSKRTSQFVSHFWFHTHIWIHSKKTYQWITTIEILPQSWKWRVTLLYSKLLTRGDQFFRVHETWRKGTTHSLSIIFHVTWMDNTPRHRGHGQHPHLSPDLDHTDYFSTRVTYLADK